VCGVQDNSINEQSLQPFLPVDVWLNEVEFAIYVYIRQFEFKELVVGGGLGGQGFKLEVIERRV
jgi:hypothetical protein